MDRASTRVAQVSTSARLLRLGESIDLQFHLPIGMTSGDVRIYPRYLDQARPGAGFAAGGDLAWVERLPVVRIGLEFREGTAAVSYRPSLPGSYLAVWEAGDETFCRYFSAIADDWIVVRFSTFVALESEPSLHATGIPLDYRLPCERFVRGDPLFEKLLGYHRHFGDTIIPVLPDTPSLATDERVRQYGEALDRARAALADPGEVRSARIDMRHEFDPGYTQALEQLGINDHCGLNEANAKPWLGMPEFPYFSSPLDCRKPRQSDGGQVVAHQWDFCGGWHFLGPVSWHYRASSGSWEETCGCLRAGMDEARDLARMSGHPAFYVPLYDGVVSGRGKYPRPDFTDGCGDDREFRFVERYQRQIAFEFTKEYPLAFARTIDIADYYRRHYLVTPRTIFVSKTEHVQYDMWWLCNWAAKRALVPRERIPMETRVSTIMEGRKGAPYWKDPLSYEYLLVEDHQRQIRFERECPNPIWWFEYTRQEQEIGPEGSAISHVETPDVHVIAPTWVGTGSGVELTLTMESETAFPDYAIALWGVPAAYSGDRSRISTDAKDFVIAKNRDGEFHLVLFFDLERRTVLHVGISDP